MTPQNFVMGLLFTEENISQGCGLLKMPWDTEEGERGCEDMCPQHNFVSACSVTRSYLPLCVPMNGSHQVFRQEYWSGLPLPPPGDLLVSGTEHLSPVSSALAGGSVTSEPPGKPCLVRGDTAFTPLLLFSGVWLCDLMHCTSLGFTIPRSLCKFTSIYTGTSKLTWHALRKIGHKTTL